MALKVVCILRWHCDCWLEDVGGWSSFRNDRLMHATTWWQAVGDDLDAAFILSGGGNIEAGGVATATPGSEEVPVTSSDTTGEVWPDPHRLPANVQQGGGRGIELSKDGADAEPRVVGGVDSQQLRPGRRGKPRCNQRRTSEEERL